MLKVSEKVFQKILKKKFNSLVGKSCKRLEVLSQRKDISSNQMIDIAKDLIKELNYETMRDIQESVEAFNSGTRIEVDFN